MSSSPSAEPSAEPASTRPALALTGLVEAYYQWNFNDPSNGLTSARGFDNRHSSFTLSSVVLDAQFDDSALLGRLTLQVGAAPSTFYLAEAAQLAEAVLFFGGEVAGDGAAAPYVPNRDHQTTATLGATTWF